MQSNFKLTEANLVYNTKLLSMKGFNNNNNKSSIYKSPDYYC